MIDPQEELERFQATAGGGYKTQEDLIDTGVAHRPLKTTEKVVDLLKGESKKRWARKFGIC